MSIAIIHRDIEREWENPCGVMGIFFKMEMLDHSQKSYALLKFWRG